VLKVIWHFFHHNYLMDFNPASNNSRQRIKTAKYRTTTFAYRSTSYLFNENNAYSLSEIRRSVPLLPAQFSQVHLALWPFAHQGFAPQPLLGL